MGVSSSRECRKQDERKRIAPSSLFVASGTLGATGLSQPLNNGLGRALCAMETGLRARAVWMVLFCPLL